MQRMLAGVGLAAALTLGLPALAVPMDTADTGSDTAAGSDDGTTGEDTGVSGEDTEGEDTEAYVAGSNAAELAGEKGGCQSIFGTTSASMLLLIGLGAAARRRRE